MTVTTLASLAAKAADIEQALRDAGFSEKPWVRQTLALAEECGEFVGAVRRWSGNARRPGQWSDVESELADVAITAFVTARALNIDLPAAINRKLDVIFTRGWRELAPAPVTEAARP